MVKCAQQRSLRTTLARHKRATCKRRPMETNIKVVPVKAEVVTQEVEPPPPKPVRLEPHQSTSKPNCSREVGCDQRRGRRRAR